MPVYTNNANNSEFTCTFETIDATDARHRGKMRVTRVECRVRRVRFVLRGAAPDPLIGAMKDYLAGAPELLKINYNNGHLIGLKLGGPDDKHNIAPMFGHFNEVAYREIERAIFDDTSIKFMRVSITYDAKEHALPVAFQVDVRRGVPDDDDDDDDMDGGFEAYRRMAMEIPSARPYPFDAAIRAEVERMLPKQKPAVEPYQFLEALNVGGTVAETTDYSEIQKKYILTANALYNLALTGAAMLTSDDASDPIQTLNLCGGDDRPQVDHFIPRGKTGANSFRNAQVLSKRQNGIKRAAIDEELMQVLLAARDPRPSRTCKKMPTHVEQKKLKRQQARSPYGRDR